MESSEDLVCINLSGKKFYVMKKNFARFPNTRLSCMVSPIPIYCRRAGAARILISFLTGAASKLIIVGAEAGNAAPQHQYNLFRGMLRDPEDPWGCQLIEKSVIKFQMYC
jgi:hypothetical protein